MINVIYIKMIFHIDLKISSDRRTSMFSIFSYKDKVSVLFQVLSADKYSNE